MKITWIINLSCLLFQTICRFYLYSEIPHLTSFYQCLKSIGSDRVAVPMIYTKDTIIGDYVQNSLNALNAGLQVQFVFLAYRCRPVEEEIQFMQNNFNLTYYDKFWLVPGNQPQSKCEWTSYSAQENCQYLQQFNRKMKELKLTFGVVTDRDTWKELFKTQTGCQELVDSLLWWLPADEQEQQGANFDSYHQIGGWKIPYSRILDGATLCGQPMARIYYI